MNGGDGRNNGLYSEKKQMYEWYMKKLEPSNEKLMKEKGNSDNTERKI